MKKTLYWSDLGRLFYRSETGNRFTGYQVIPAEKGTFALSCPMGEYVIHGNEHSAREAAEVMALKRILSEETK